MACRWRWVVPGQVLPAVCSEQAYSVTAAAVSLAMVARLAWLAMAVNSACLAMVVNSAFLASAEH